MKRAYKKKPLTMTQLKVFEDLKGELRGWNIESVAEEANLAPSTLYFWLDGKTRKPRLDTIIRAAEAIGFDVGLIKKQVNVRTGRQSSGPILEDNPPVLRIVK
jgi:transcriptional regulator with XRE-family HTH domain